MTTDTPEPADWIADATRRLARLGEEEEAAWPEGLRALRDAVAHRIADLPRAGKPLDTGSPGVSMTHLALGKALTAELAAPAAAAAAAIVSVKVQVAGRRASRIEIEIVAVGADERDATYLADGDSLRRAAAQVTERLLGITAPTIDLTWVDLVLPPER